MFPHVDYRTGGPLPAQLLPSTPETLSEVSSSLPNSKWKIVTSTRREIQRINEDIIFNISLQHSGLLFIIIIIIIDIVIVFLLLVYLHFKSFFFLFARKLHGWID